MFSEIWRSVALTHLWTKASNGERILRIADQADNVLHVKGRTIPTRKNLLSWAGWVASQKWVACGNLAHLPLSHQNEEKRSVEKVRVRLRLLDFQGATGTYSARELQVLEVDREGRKLPVPP